MAPAIAVCAAFAAEPPGILRPKWTLSFSSRVEWVELLEQQWLAAACADGTVHVYRLESSAPCEAASLTATPGVRLVGAFHGTLFCIDRTTLYAWKLDASSADCATDWSWRRGERPLTTQPALLDPETLPDVPQAAITREGVLLIDSTGRIALFQETDAQPARIGRMDAARNARIVASPLLARCALLWQDGEHCRGAWLAPTGDGFQTSAFELGETLPIKTARLDDWLIAVWPRRALAVNATGQRHETIFDSTVFATASTCAFWLPSPRAERVSERPRPQLVTAHDLSIVQYDLVTGARVFPPAAPSAGVHRSNSITRVELFGDAAAATDMLGVTVVDLASHELLARLEGRRPDRPISFDLAGDAARGVFGAAITDEKAARWSYREASTLGVDSAGTTPLPPGERRDRTLIPLEPGPANGLLQIVWTADGFLVCSRGHTLGFRP